LPGRALALKVAGGGAPFTVSSSRKVGKLNTDTLDGFDSSSFVEGGGQVRGFDVTLGKLDKATVLVIPGYGKITPGCETLGGEERT
jgi:hypothetical protein